MTHWGARDESSKKSNSERSHLGDTKRKSPTLGRNPESDGAARLEQRLESMRPTGSRESRQLLVSWTTNKFRAFGITTILVKNQMKIKRQFNSCMM